jgi:flagellar basal-body rod protein FlgB
MINGLFSDSFYVASKKMLDVTALRQEAIASNLANVETPNYKRMDVSSTFESQLRQAVGGGDVNQVDAMQPSLSQDTTSNPGRSDGNTVQLEDELMKMNQNVVEHALETQLVSADLMRMRMAITGKS